MMDTTAHTVKGETLGGDMPKPVKLLPTLNLSSKDVPEIKDWTVGETYVMVVKVKMTGANTDRFSSDPNMVRGTFEIQKVRVTTDKADYEDEFASMQQQAKDSQADD